MIKIFLSHIVLFIFLGLVVIGLFYLLLDFIFGSKCPKCKKRGFRLISEATMSDNYNAYGSNEYFVIHKCSKCGYSRGGYESRANSSSG